MLNKIVYNNLITLRNANKGKKIFIDVFYNNLFLYFLNFFYRKGYIIGYIFNNLKTVRIYLKYYKDKGLLSGLRFTYFKPSFSYKALKHLRYCYIFENVLYLFTTSFGFFTLDDMFRYGFNIGGILYFYLIFN